MNEKPICAVNGMLAPKAMCSKIIVGVAGCGYDGKCEDQRYKVITVDLQLTKKTNEKLNADEIKNLNLVIGYFQVGIRTTRILRSIKQR